MRGFFIKNAWHLRLFLKISILSEVIFREIEAFFQLMCWFFKDCKALKKTGIDSFLE
jgi:hypothetical protein